MGTIVIHAGMPKAGSSAVQHWLRTNARRLRRKHDITLAVAAVDDPIRVREFDSRGSINSHALGQAMGKGEEVWRATLARFFSDLQTLSDEHAFVVLTSETFDVPVSHADESFLAGLDDLAAEHRVLISSYVRPQHTAMEAAWRQWGFRYGVSPSDYMRRRARWLDAATTHADVRRLAPRVGFEPRPFRADLLDEGSIVVDFARRYLEIEVPRDESPPINPGLPLELINLLRSAPKGMFWSSPHDNAELSRIKALFSEVQIPESADVRRSRLILQDFCHRTFEPGNRELIRELGWGIEEFVPAPDEPVEGELEDLDELWAWHASEPEREILFHAIAQALQDVRPRRRIKGA